MKQLFSSLLIALFTICFSGVVNARPAAQSYHDYAAIASTPIQLAQLNGGLIFPGPGTPHSSGVSYSGPGDVFSGAVVWYSCARAYSSAIAAGTSLCELSDPAAPTVVICTLKLGSNGFVDLTNTANCGGSVPATKCGATVATFCNVKTVFNQGSTGSTNDCSQGTGGNQPTLLFSAVNSLPGLKAVAASAQFMPCGSLTQAVPFSLSGVYKVTGTVTTEQTMVGGAATSLVFGKSTTANTAGLSGGDVNFVSVASMTDITLFHALNGLLASGSSTAFLLADGSNSGTGNADGFSFSDTLRIMRSAGCCNLDGIMMEVGIWNASVDSTAAGNLNSNQHGANGYNF